MSKIIHGLKDYVSPHEVNQQIHEEIPQEIVDADDLMMRGELDEALRVVNKFLNHNYENVPALVTAGRICYLADRLGMAQAFFKLATKLRPDISMAWSDLGSCYQEGTDWNEGEDCLRRAIKLDPRNANAWSNLAQLYVNNAQPMKAINCADKALSISTTLSDPKYNRSLAKLQLGDWETGWEGFDCKLGVKDGRAERTYGIVPRWTGVNGMKLVAFGEQGLGDEIMFASCIPDLLKENEVVIECDSRLQGLFARSFPECRVYGTRYQTGLEWPIKENLDAKVAFGSLPGFYRKSIESFPGTPFLKADPERRLAARALLDSLGNKKKIGIAWAGGIHKTGAARRSVLLYDMLPIIEQDATFISLQYRDADEVSILEENHGIKVHHWPWAVMGKDYDNTAALVAELDLVITVTQACVHLAGGLGKPCWVLTPKQPMWRYGLTGDSMPWYKSVKLYRQKTEWQQTISEIAKDLREWLKSA